MPYQNQTHCVNRLMKIHSIRFKLIASLCGVSLFIGLISVLVGGNLLYQSVIDEANNRIRQDLNVARVIYDDRIDSVRLALEITASAPEFGAAVAASGPQVAAQDIRRLFGRLKLDFFGITDARGNVTCRYGQTKTVTPPYATANPMVLEVLTTGRAVSGTMVLSRAQLMFEDPLLADRAAIQIRQSALAPPDSPDRETQGLVIGAAVPIMAENCVIGVIYGGFLLNKQTAVVDKIGATVFRNETYKGRNVGTSTIFLKDLRIATSVKTASGKRALGTFAASDVAGQVLDRGERWTDRAMVLNDWYITAYEPITDIRGDRVGMFYVGVLEAKYWDVRKRAILVFTGITLAGVTIAICLGWLFTGRIMRPVSQLIRASSEISDGNFSPDIGPISKDDIGQLQQKFMSMTQALIEREKRQKAESEIQLIHSQKQASVGKLAAGVAHEINNPLTAVLTFTHLILRRPDLPEDVRADLDIVAAQTERVRDIVKSLLDFSRQTALTPEPLDINHLIEACVKLMENQALVKGVHLGFTAAPDLGEFRVDRNQIQSVMINMIINALDATPAGGKIAILTLAANSPAGVDITISDTGSGIRPEHMDNLFDPFFTTKDVGKGTGLGLAVSAGIIQRHGGRITVRSKPAAGTTFRIRLPHCPTGDVLCEEPGQGGLA